MKPCNWIFYKSENLWNCQTWTPLISLEDVGNSSLKGHNSMPPNSIFNELFNFCFSFASAGSACTDDLRTCFHENKSSGPGHHCLPIYRTDVCNYGLWAKSRPSADFYKQSAGTQHCPRIYILPIAASGLACGARNMHACPFPETVCWSLI